MPLARFTLDSAVVRAALATIRDLRGALGRVALGLSVRVVNERGARTDSALVKIGGYDEHQVRLVDLPRVTAAQRAVRLAVMLERR